MILIDKKKFADDYCKKMCAGGCSDQARDVCEFMRLLDSQPVAFNVAAVVELLKDELEKAYDECFDYPYIIEEAIEIMKGGGVS